jgi:integrase
LDKICAEPTGANSKTTMGTVPIAAITPKAVRVIRDRIGREHPEQANAYVKALRQVFKYAVEAEIVANNPTRDVPIIASDSEGFHTWTIEEVEEFEAFHPIGSQARLAMALMLYTGQRRSDAVRFGPNHIKDGWLRFTQFKNRKRKPVKLEIPVRPELQEIIDRSPCGSVTFLVNTYGRPFTDDHFGAWFRKRCKEAGVPGRAHGLRKAAASRLAELGAPEKEIMAITGHSTSKEIMRYTRGANQRILAGNAMSRHKVEKK